MTIVNLNANLDPSYYRMEEATGDRELIDTFMSKRPSVEERDAAGKALREKVPRASHARYEPAADRPDPVSILEKQNEGRVAKLVPVRFARMLASPFTFLRGSAAVMAGDLSGTPTTGMQVAACGDMHVSNFGVFASAERNLIFAINDFDEVHPGPWEWDLKRLAASAACRRTLHGRATRCRRRRRRRRSCARIASASGATPGWAFSGSGTSVSTNPPCSRRFRPSCGAAPSASWTRRAARATSGRWGSSPPRSTASTASSRTCRCIVRETHSMRPAGGGSARQDAARAISPR